MTSSTNARLDHYVYTVESLARARALLNPGGVMVLSFDGKILDEVARVELGKTDNSQIIQAATAVWL